MSDRLAELRRQRALVQEHLAWLDREMAMLEGPVSAPVVPPTTSGSRSTNPITGVPTATGSVGSSITTFKDPAADTILEEYRVAPTALKENVRKGCLLYFVAAFALLILVVAVLYFALSAR